MCSKLSRWDGGRGGLELVRGIVGAGGGPPDQGASQFARVQDNTEVFFDIMNSMLGSYPIPTQF